MLQQSTSPQSAEPDPGSGPSLADAAPGAGDAASTEEVGSAIAQSIDSFADRLDQFISDPTFATAWDAFGPAVISLGEGLLALIVLVVITMFVARWVSRLTKAGLDRLKLESTVVTFISRIVKYAVWILAVPIAFEILGVRTTSLAALIGAAGIAIGLALQGSLSNIAAGVMLLLLRPFKIGDWIELDDEFGEVKDVGIFYTNILTFGGKTVILPNSHVLSNKIENYTDTRHRRVEVPVGVAYRSDLHKTIDVLTDAAKGVKERVRDKDPEIVLVGFGDSSINYEVRVYSENHEFLEVRTATVLAIKDALDEAGIEIPFPQRDLNFRTDARVRVLQGAGGEGGPGT